jgi:hypothetical protein
LFTVLRTVLLGAGNGETKSEAKRCQHAFFEMFFESFSKCSSGATGLAGLMTGDKLGTVLIPVPFFWSRILFVFGGLVLPVQSICFLVF